MIRIDVGKIEVIATFVEAFTPAFVSGFPMTHAVTPFSLKDAPALIERLLPVQKLSAEAYRTHLRSFRRSSKID